MRETPLHILDLGTGTGCLIISLLKEYKNAKGVAVDQSANALKQLN
ncbi:MAG: methyltransferase [Holosporaceae bacterium]|nr:MAG: methyltransferase [Holosporaceae bacterium]